MHRSISIQLAVKIRPDSLAFRPRRRRLAATKAPAGGARTSWSRFLQPDVDVEHFRRRASGWCLSLPSKLRLPLRWIAILRDHRPGRPRRNQQCPQLLAGHLLKKLLLAVADAVIVASATLARGPEVVSDMLDGLRAWMAEREYVSVEQLKGSLSRASGPDPAAFERGNYMRALVSYAPRPGT